MARCSACGAENPDGQRFCGSCGVALGVRAVERRKLVTTVFCDLAGSTAMGERVDSEIVFDLMSSYFDAVRVALEGHGGAVEKFIGDAVVGMFGVPVVHEDDALRACRAALEIQQRVSDLNVELEERHGMRIAVRMGVNTGEVVAGASERERFVRGDAVVLGDAVNVAARLEQAAKPGEVLLGEATARLVRAAVTVEALEPIRVKGKAEPLAAFRLLGVTAAGQPPRRAVTPLVGRGAELESLVAAFEAVCAERSCRLVTVVGEPGAGKSRLARELLGHIAPRARTARGGCLSYGEGVTYWAVAEIVRGLAGISEEQSASAVRQQLDVLLADAPHREAVAAQAARLLAIDEGATTPEELAWAVRRLLAAVAGEQPLVLVVDDIHWAEPLLLELLADLPGAVKDVPILVVCLARKDLLERAPDWPVTVTLEPLAEEAVDELLADLGVPRGLRARLAQAAAGNPLFAEELVAMLADDGLLVADRSSVPEAAQLALPVSLNALIGARLDRLDPPARDALERGAVEGELFHEGAVAALSRPLPREALHARLEELERRDLVGPAVPAFADELAFRFKHILVREAAYRGTSKKWRARFHEQFAGWLIGAIGDRLAEVEEIVGYHLEQAFLYRRELGALVDGRSELGERAARHLVAAARRASALGNRDAVAGLLERALEIGITEPHERVRAQVELGSALVGTRLQEAEAVLTDAHDVAVSLGERGAAALALIRLSWKRTGDPSSTWESREASCREAIETFTELGDEPGLADGRHLLAVSLTALGRLDEAQVEIERALEHAEAAGLPELLRGTINTLLYGICVGPTPADEAIRRCEELFAKARGDRLIDANVRRALGLSYAMAGRRGEALESIRQSSLVLDDLRVGGVYRDVAAYALELAGDRDGAERELLTMWRYYRELGEGAFERRAWRAATSLAWLYCDEGRWEEAREIQAYGRGLEGGFGMAVERSLAVEARLEARAGRLDEALALAERARARVDTTSGLVNQQAIVREALAEVLDTAGEPARAEQARREAIARYAQKGNVASAARVRRGRPS